MPKATNTPKRNYSVRPRNYSVGPRTSMVCEPAGAQPALRRTNTRRQLKKTASSSVRGMQKLGNLAYERQWAKDRKQAYAGEHIVYNVGMKKGSGFACNCTICPCQHM